MPFGAADFSVALLGALRLLPAWSEERADVIRRMRLLTSVAAFDAIAFLGLARVRVVVSAAVPPPPVVWVVDVRFCGWSTRAVCAVRARPWWELA